MHNDPPSEEEDDQEEEDDSELDFRPIAGNWVGELTALPPYGNNCKFRVEFSLDSTALKTEEQSAGTCPRGDVQLRHFADSDSLRGRIDAELDGVGADATGNASRMAG